MKKSWNLSSLMMMWLRWRLNDKIRQLRLSHGYDQNKILEELAAFEVQYGCTLSEKKKVAVVLRVGKHEYVSIMMVTSTQIRATVRDLVVLMRRQ